jgi:hypothetical protein
MQHTLTFRAERGLVVAQVRTSPHPVDLVADVEAGVRNAHEDPTQVVARFELLPHVARRLMERLGEEIEAAEAQGLS